MSAPLPIEIRPARDDDASAMASLSTQLGYPADAPAMARRMAAIRSADAGIVFVAESAGRVIGWTHVAAIVALEAEPFAELRGLVVDESVRSRGVGAALVRTCETWAREVGLPVLRVRCNVLRERTHGFYDREGFRRVKQQLTFVKDL